jgi:hypothetical protein
VPRFIHAIPYNLSLVVYLLAYCRKCRLRISSWMRPDCTRWGKRSPIPRHLLVPASLLRLPGNTIIVNRVLSATTEIQTDNRPSVLDHVFNRMRHRVTYTVTDKPAAIWRLSTLHRSMKGTQNCSVAVKVKNDSQILLNDNPSTDEKSHDEQDVHGRHMILPNAYKYGWRRLLHLYKGDVIAADTRIWT